jgi:DNA-binding protein YbaB
MLGKLKDTANALGNLNKMKAQQDKLQKILASVQVTGISKNGKVSVTVTGDQKIVQNSLKIDPSIITFVYENYTSQDKEDQLLGKSVTEAIEDAMNKVQPEVVKKMQETGSIGDLMGMLSGAM